jgi:hypothetical protein
MNTSTNKKSTVQVSSKEVKDKPNISMTLDEAAEYLKRLGEWWAIRNCSRDTLIKWATYLKEHGAK